MTGQVAEYVPTGGDLRVLLVRDRPQETPRAILKTPAEAVAGIGPSIPDDGREHFLVACLSVRRRLIGLHTVSIGCLTSSLVHPREVFRPAILAGAAAVVLAHNHPSGDPEPSPEDVALTRRLVSAGVLIGIEVLDHVVIGSGTGRWVSLKDRGVL